MSEFYQYDPQQMTCSFKGENITGFAEGTFIEIERNEDAYTVYVGATGDVTRTRSRNRTGKATLTLMAQAPSNDSLMDIHMDDEQFGDGVGPLLIKDLNGLTVARAAEAWVTKVPKVERGKEAGTSQWVLECAVIIIEARGNVV